MSDSDSNSPPGYCQCGCGAKTTVVARNIPERGLKKGDPSRFIPGHGMKARFRDMRDPNPSGLCMCGCGNPVPLAKRSDYSAGIVAGGHIRFLLHHKGKEPGGGPRQRKRKPLAPCKCGCGGMAHGDWLNGHWHIAKARERVKDGWQTCRHCGERKPATTEFFSPDKRRATGIRCLCKKCHAEATLDANRKWREKNAAILNELNKRWKKANPEKHKAQGHRRRAKVLQAPGSHTGDDIKEQFERQKGRCYYCGKKVGKRYHVDHVMPLALGGADGPENLVIACAYCNGSKGAKHPMDYCGRML